MLFVKQRIAALLYCKQCIPHLLSALLPIFKCPCNAQSKPILPILWPVSDCVELAYFPLHGFR